MRKQSWVLASSFVLAGALVTASALADVNWTGPGYYVETTETGLDTELVSGPYATLDECNAAKPADTQDDVYDCEYEAGNGGGGLQ